MLTRVRLNRPPDPNETLSLRPPTRPPDRSHHCRRFDRPQFPIHHPSGFTQISASTASQNQATGATGLSCVALSLFRHHHTADATLPFHSDPLYKPLKTLLPLPFQPCGTTPWTCTTPRRRSRSGRICTLKYGRRTRTDATVLPYPLCHALFAMPSAARVGPYPHRH